MRPFPHLRRLSTALAQGLVEADATRQRSQRLARLVAVLLVFACAALATQWALRLLAPTRPVPAGALQEGADAVGTLAAEGARLFGDKPGPRPQAPTRYRLYGVIGGGDRAGAALIGIGGEPAKAYAVGSLLAPGVRLVSTGFGRAEIEQRGLRSVLSTRPGAGGGEAMPRSAPASLQPMGGPVAEPARGPGAALATPYATPQDRD